MSVCWTSDQERAITAYGKGVTVSAAAGSGKTAVLIERIIRLLTDKEKRIPADKLLAVTFTIDAAAQMRDKLNEAFEEKLREDPNDTWVLQQQSLVQLARISTIDSFCFDMVKDNLNKFEFTGGLKILGDAERDLIFDTAFEQAAEELCAGSPEEYAMLDNFFSVENGSLKRNIKAIYEHIRSICHSDKWVSQTISSYTDDEFFKCVYNRAFERFDEEIKKARALLDDANYCYNYTVSADGKNYRFCEAFRAAEEDLAICRSFFDSRELAAKHRNGEEMNKYTPEKYKQLRISGKRPEDINAVLSDVKVRFKQDIDLVVEILNDASRGLELSETHLRKNMKEAGKLFSAMMRLERRIEEVLYDIKLEKNAVDFSDIELMTKNLLVRETDEGFVRTELAEEIRSGGLYKIIMIDEYQDVNDVQEIIFKAISDTDDLAYMGTNTFIVGDMKQAIYGFRKTNPDLFRNCIEMAKDAANKEKLEHISLQKNFRSRKEVISVSNYFFETLMSRGCGQVDYNDDERLEAGAGYTDRSVPSEVLLVDVPYDNDTKLPEEFRASARRIKEMISSGTPVCEKGEDRPCRQSDFCILVNTNENIKQAAEALSEVGLRAYCEDTDGYIKSREISLALDILRSVDNPMNDIALAAVMMSPIMGFTPDDMTQVRLRCRVEKSKKLNHIYQILSGAAREPDTDEKYAKYVDMGDSVLQKKCRSAFELVESLRFCSMSMSLSRLIRRIFDVTDIMGISSLYLDSAKKRANLRLLQQYAGEYEQSGNEGVTGFLRFIDSVSGNDKAFKNAATVTAGGDSVNVKTYHKSKGLEYPFVLLCTLSKKLVRDDAGSESIKLHKSLGCAFEMKDSRLNVRRVNLYYDYLADILEREQKSEKMRLFYVGCTRAKEKLILVCSNEKAGRTSHDKLLERLRNAVKDSAAFERIPSELVSAQVSMLDWVVVCLAKLQGNEALEDWLGMPLDTVTKAVPREKVDIRYITVGCSESEYDTSEKKIRPVRAEADFSLVSQLLKKYRYENLATESKLPAKLTVTEIVAAESVKNSGDKSPEFFPNLPRLNDELDKLTAAEKGTYTHKFMEVADYQKASKSVRCELERLKNTGMMSEREAKGVYVNRLEEFVRSELFGRMLASSDLRREQKFLTSVKDLDLAEELKEYTTENGFIQGIADCIFREDDGWVLVDYKTDNFKATDEMKKYKTQLMLYKAAFELILGEKVKSSFIYSFRLGEGLEFDL